MNYNLEIDKAVETIKKDNAKLVLLQLPHGLKPKAKEIQKEIESKSDARTIVWLGGGYGACDMPLGVDKLGVDLVIQWGHSVYKK